MEEIHTIWERRRGLDLWSIPHFLFGILTALLPSFVAVSFMTAFILTVVLTLVWEVYEKFIHIQESVPNLMFDLVLPILSFVLTTYLIGVYAPSEMTLRLVGLFVFVVYIGLNGLGWTAHKKRERARMGL